MSKQSNKFFKKKHGALFLAAALTVGGLPPAMFPTTASAADAGEALISTSGGTTRYDIVDGEQSSEAVIDPGILIQDSPYTINLDAATVLLENFQAGDQLTFTAATGITGTYNPANGVLTLKGTASAEAYNQTLSTVAFSTTSSNTSVRTVRFALGDALPNDANGHFYKYINKRSNITWAAAKNEAAADNYFGSEGYLVTITDAQENEFVKEKTLGLGWIGAQDIQRKNGEPVNTGDWRWVTGPEGQQDSGNGQKFYEGYLGGTKIGYANWAASEPNNYSGLEYVAHIYGPGREAGHWNDYPLSNNVTGYVIEYGGMASDENLDIIAEKTIAVVNSTDLKQAVEEGDQLDQEDYMVAEWPAYKKALEDAKAVLDNKTKTQEEVDKAVQELKTARELLKPRLITEPSGGLVNVSKPELKGVVDQDSKVTVELKDENGKVIETREVEADSNGNWSFTPSAELPDGKYTVDVTALKNGKVTSQSKTIVVESAQKSHLTGLELNANDGTSIPLSPAIAENTYNYTATTATYSVYFTPTLDSLAGLDPNAKIEFSLNNGAWTDAASGKASNELPLNEGSNTIVVKVTVNGREKLYTLTVFRAFNNNGNSGGGGGGSTTPTTPAAPSTPEAPKGNLDVTLNGKDDPFATGTTSTADGRTTTSVKVDPDKLGKAVSEGTGQDLSIHSPNEGDMTVDGLTADTLKKLGDKGASLKISNPLAIYPVPVGKMNLNAVAGQLGNAALNDIGVRIDIKRSSDALIASAKNKAAAGGYELLVDPVDLDLTFSHGGQTVKSGQLNGYAAKYIALPEGIDPNRITTGVVVNPDGSVYHLPTVVTKIGNRYYAQIHDLRSIGTYSVIWNPQDFTDVKTHWGQADVNNIAARLDLKGNGDNTFSPGRSVTRSEFAEIVVLGLGLMRQEASQNNFPDVPTSAWYGNALAIADEFDIVRGYDDGKFYGNQPITREQGFAMVARAYRLIKSEAVVSQNTSALSEYKDGASVSNWAKADVAQLIEAGIIQGEGTHLSPKAPMTRAEVTALIARMLKITNLIDK
ncbi:S-layer homology domain-containing protein [Paenibacillus sp. FSL R5-0473]|uniref:S-layer homology domain-containing protein n=1 Tax=Paenibacillus sp. FSL R5-0473 TaxID=2921642 RepID=UPI0030FCD429